jgi:hypothetical protein
MTLQLQFLRRMMRRRFGRLLRHPGLVSPDPVVLSCHLLVLPLMQVAAVLLAMQVVVVLLTTQLVCPTTQALAM